MNYESFFFFFWALIQASMFLWSKKGSSGLLLTRLPEELGGRGQGGGESMSLSAAFDFLVKEWGEVENIQF